MRPLLPGLLLLLGSASVLLADPCGMVPPITPGGNIPIARTGYQQTYVFWQPGENGQKGLETFVIAPGFSGKVEEFGMLIPFPSVPSLRKVPDAIFDHLAKAVDPPEVVVDLRYQFARGAAFGGAVRRKSRTTLEFRQDAKKDVVVVVKQEAVGMYEVTVLEAGSAKALKRWMDDHDYVYPTGMDDACEDYVDLGWCFVAVKTKVADKSAADPQPGQRNVDPKLPSGASFDGQVQAMGFRFEVDDLVVPMRLSAFNKGDLHNVVYVLSTDPMKIDGIPQEFVVRQVDGETLRSNVTQPLPLRIYGGTVSDIPEWRSKNLPSERNPTPHNGAAKDLFAGDLLTAETRALSHPHEESEKMLLMIGERLGLRGQEIDSLNEASLTKEREAIVEKSLGSLRKDFTLTVVDGNFPRELIASRNLTFSPFAMPSRRNSAEFYNAVQKGPQANPGGVLHHGALSRVAPEADEEKTIISSTTPVAPLLPIGVVLLVGLTTLGVSRRNRASR